MDKTKTDVFRSLLAKVPEIGMHLKTIGACACSSRGAANGMAIMLATVYADMSKEERKQTILALVGGNPSPEGISDELKKTIAGALSELNAGVGYLDLMVKATFVSLMPHLAEDTPCCAEKQEDRLPSLEELDWGEEEDKE